MATNCESCGYKTNEVKSSAGIGEHGITIRVKVETEDVLNKEVVIVSLIVEVSRFYQDIFLY